jgi:hypothetical protein
MFESDVPVAIRGGTLFHWVRVFTLSRAAVTHFLFLQDVLALVHASVSRLIALPCERERGVAEE